MTSLLTVARSGIASTFLLARLRWRMIRVTGVRTAIVGAAFFFACATAIIANFGFAIAAVAQDPTSPVNTFARDLVAQLSDGRIEGIVSLTLVVLMSVALFGPFTGTGTVSLAAAEDLFGMRPARAHRYFDSLAVNAVSGLGILQLLGLVGLNSLLALDGPRLPGMLFAFALWGCLIALMTLIAWTIEWTVRRFGRWQRYTVAAIFASLGGVIYVTNPDAATSLYGVGQAYVALLRGAEFSLLLTAVIPCAFLIGAALVLSGLRMFLNADKYLPPTNHTGKTGRYRAFPAAPVLVAFRVVMGTVLRTPQTRRPMIAAIVFGTPAVIAVPMDPLLASSLSFAIPLTIALSWPANFFGILGTGMPWLMSQPRITLAWVKALLLAQVVLTLAVVAVLSGVAVLFGRASVPQVQGVLLQAAFITFAVSGVTALLAVSKPLRAQLAGRGDALVPPVTALIYMVLLLAFTALPGAAFGGMLTDSPAVEALALLAPGAIGLLCGAIALLRWRSPEVRSHVTSIVGAE